MPNDTSGPAFPAEQHFVDGTKRWCHGMSLRDYFAGQALVGIVASSAASENHVAAMAYVMADAMLKERDE